MKDQRIMIGKKIQDLGEIREILDASAKKNNNLLIFFLTFGLYISISTLGTTDAALLLPKQGFKMPLIDFELDLLNFFRLAPLLLLLLHINLLFGHHKHLEKLHTYKNKIDINSIDPSLYGFAFLMGNHGFSGRIINFILWILLYILPLLVFLLIYIRFADYHDGSITLLHLSIIILDLIFIISSIIYNDIFYKSSYVDRSANILNIISKIIVYPFIIFIGVLTVLYYIVFFSPIVQDDYNPSYLQKIKNDCLPKWICSSINLIYEHKKYCYPRLIVTEEEMAKISKSALYIPRVLGMDGIVAEKEKKLILKYGTRIDLTNRNLRYAVLKSSILTRADMKKSWLDAADLRKSHMQAVDLTDASFIDAKLTEAKLQSADFIRTNLHNANLVRANMNQATFDACNLTGAFLQKAQLKGSKLVSFFENTNNLTNTNLKGANLMNADLQGSDLTGASLQDANIAGTVFDNANLTAVNLSGARFHVTLDKMGNTYFLRGLPSFKETTMFGVNIDKYKKQNSNSTKKQNTILFDVNTSIYPVIFEVNTSKRYPILPDKDISKYPKLFDTNISETYTVTVDTNISEKPLFLVDVNISEENLTFHRIRIKYLETVINGIPINDESQKKRNELEEILNSSRSENVKNKDCNNSKNDIEKCLKMIYAFIKDLKNKFIDL